MILDYSLSQAGKKVLHHYCDCLDRGPLLLDKESVLNTWNPICSNDALECRVAILEGQRTKCPRWKCVITGFA